jgi:hypothetical protein
MGSRKRRRKASDGGRRWDRRRTVRSRCWGCREIYTHKRLGMEGVWRRANGMSPMAYVSEQLADLPRHSITTSTSWLRRPSKSRCVPKARIRSSGHA